MEPTSTPITDQGLEDLQPKGDVSPEMVQKIISRVRFLFRQVGDNLPARDLEQQVMVYRLKGKT